MTESFAFTYYYKSCTKASSHDSLRHFAFFSDAQTNSMYGPCFGIAHFYLMAHWQFTYEKKKENFCLLKTGFHTVTMVSNAD